MANTTPSKPKTRKRKRKAKVKVSTRAKVVRKDSVRADTLPRMPAQMPRTNGTVLKVKIKRK